VGEDRWDTKSEPAIRAFQADIIKTAESKLGRPLTEREQQFITSRLGFIALEMISDTVRALDPERLGSYLNSDG
jgi:hypothetical protein